MNEVQPLYRCTGCKRGVLNRSVARCLYCGAELPAEARLAPELVAAREAEHARLEARRLRIETQKPQESTLGPLDVIDGIEVASDLADLVGDGISALGDLLS